MFACVPLTFQSHGNGDSAPRHVDFEVQDCPQARINLMRALSGSPHRPTWFRLDLDNGDAVRFQGRLDKRPLPGPRNNRIRVSGSLTDAEGYETLEENPQFTFLAPDARSMALYDDGPILQPGAYR